MHVSRFSTWEAKAGRSQVWGQPGLHPKTLSHETINCFKAQLRYTNAYEDEGLEA